MWCNVLSGISFAVVPLKIHVSGRPSALSVSHTACTNSPGDESIRVRSLLGARQVFTRQEAIRGSLRARVVEETCLVPDLSLCRGIV